ncbi:MAG: hypothetical protein K6T91_03365 [Firmicutes bacterium]|nr:hypothetical protein [Bacillota bacterium]
MRIMINEPDGRMSGIVIGETIGVNYDVYFKFKDLDGKLGQETEKMLQEAIDCISMDIDNEHERLIRERISGVLNNLLELAKKNPNGMWKVS